MKWFDDNEQLSAMSRSDILDLLATEATEARLAELESEEKNWSTQESHLLHEEDSVDLD